MEKEIYSPKKICLGCGFSGGIYEFSPSIEIGSGDFRIFHLYAGMKGTLYCNQCKRKYLLKIAGIKNLNDKQKKFLEEKIEDEKCIFEKK